MKTHLLALAAAFGSALLSFAAPFLPGPLDDALAGWWPGFIFGVLVLATREAPVWRTALFVASSTLVYWGASEMAAALYLQASWPVVLSCTFAGALAAFVLFAIVSFLTHGALPVVPLVSSVVVGALGGLSIGYAFETSDDFAFVCFLAGYLIWQGGFALICASIPWWWPAARVSAPAPGTP